MPSGLLGGWLQAEEAPDLGQYEAWLREAYFAAQRGDRLGLEQVAPQIVAAEQVRLPDGALAAANNAWLAEALERPDADLGPVAQRLGAIVDGLAQPAGASGPEALQRLRDILSNPPFAEAAPAESGWLDRLLEGLLELLARLFGATGDAVGSGGGQLLGWLLLGLGVLAVVAVLVYAALSLRRGITREAALRDDPEADLTSVDALRQATEIARAGDYRTAVRYLYLASLLWLDERGALRYDRALTNREYLLQVRSNADLHARLLPVIETFDRVWYGHAPIDQAAFDSYRRQIDELRRAT